jgi:hypothetical protein
MQLALTMVLFTIGGYFLDRWLETMPWLTIAGAVLGMTAVFIHIVRVSQSLGTSKRSRRAAKADDTGRSVEDALASRAPGADAYGSEPLPSQSGMIASAGAGGSGDFGREDFTALEREFARIGEVRGGKLLLPAWDALDMIEAARKKRIPVLGIHTFVTTDEGTRPVDTLDLSAGGMIKEGWDEAARFIEDLRDGGLHFEVMFGKKDQER